MHIHSSSILHMKCLNISFLSRTSHQGRTWHLQMGQRWTKHTDRVREKTFLPTFCFFMSPFAHKKIGVVGLNWNLNKYLTTWASCMLMIYSLKVHLWDSQDQSHQSLLSTSSCCFCCRSQITATLYSLISLAFYCKNLKRLRKVPVLLSSVGKKHSMLYPSSTRHTVLPLSSKLCPSIPVWATGTLPPKSVSLVCLCYLSLCAMYQAWEMQQTFLFSLFWAPVF